MPLDRLHVGRRECYFVSDEVYLSLSDICIMDLKTDPWGEEKLQTMLQRVEQKKRRLPSLRCISHRIQSVITFAPCRSRFPSPIHNGPMLSATSRSKASGSS
jgi:hypothetical protein